MDYSKIDVDNRIDSNYKHELVGGTKSLAISNTVGMMSELERGSVITVLSNNLGYPLTSVANELYGSSRYSNFVNKTGKGDHIEYGQVQKLYTSQKGTKTFQIDVSKIETPQTLDTGQEVVSYSTDYYTKDQLKNNLNEFVETVLNNPGERFVLMTALGSRTIGSKIMVDNAPVELSKDVIVDILSDIFVERGIPSIDNLVLSDSFFANILNESVIAKNPKLLNQDIVLAKELSNIVNESASVKDIFSDVSEADLDAAFRDLNVTDEILFNLSENDLMGIKKHAQANVRIDISKREYRAEVNALGRFTALLAIYNNNSFSLTKTSQGATSVMYSELVKSLGNVVTAMRLKAQFLTNNSDNSSLTIKEKISNFVGEKSKYSVEDITKNVNLINNNYGLCL